MNKNRFIEKYKNKTNKELKDILYGEINYQDEAKEASIQILEERNEQLSDFETSENDIKLDKKEIISDKSIDLKKTEKVGHLTDDTNAPELHSKRVITMFSAIFTTIFGAVLLMYNMKQTNNQKGRIQVLIFSVLYTIVSIVVLNLLKRGTGLVLVLNLAGAGMLTEYFWNKFIGKEFKYRKRSWLKPAIISLLILIPFALMVIYG